MFFFSLVDNSCIQINCIHKSTEPGYYEAGETPDDPNGFGIRLENDIVVVPVELENNFGNLNFFGFEEMTFVPYQHKLIKFELLTEKEVKDFGLKNVFSYKCFAN